MAYYPSFLLLPRRVFGVQICLACFWHIPQEFCGSAHSGGLDITRWCHLKAAFLRRLAVAICLARFLCRFFLEAAFLRRLAVAICLARFLCRLFLEGDHALQGKKTSPPIGAEDGPVRPVSFHKFNGLASDYHKSRSQDRSIWHFPCEEVDYPYQRSSL